jgi:hypothetical protein
MGFLLLLLLLLRLRSRTETLLLLLDVVAGLRCRASLLLRLLRPGSPVGVLVVLGRGECLFLRRSGISDRAGDLLAVVRDTLLGLRRRVLDLLRWDEVVRSHGTVLVLVAGRRGRRAYGASGCCWRTHVVVILRRGRADRGSLSLLGECVPVCNLVGALW